MTAVNKSNVLKISDGLFLRECRAIAEDNPDIVYEEELVDAVAARLVRDRGGYDVLVTTNLFGDILSNEAAELSGGLGLAGSLNHGDRHAMAQASHGSAPDIAGRGIANPSSMILSVCLLLDHLGTKSGDTHLSSAARLIEGALMDSLGDAGTRTPDLGGNGTTGSATEAVINRFHGAMVPAT